MFCYTIVYTPLLLPPTLLRLLSQHQHLRLAKLVVAGGDDTVAGLESCSHFVLLRVLSADGDGGADGFFAIFAHLIYPLATGGLVEIAAWDDYSLSASGCCVSNVRSYLIHSIAKAKQAKPMPKLMMLTTDCRRYFFIC